MAGLELQRSRVLARHENARELLPGNPISVRVLEGPDNDLHYYAFEVERLRHIAVASSKVFRSEEIKGELAKLDDAIPGLKKVRDALTHFNDVPFLDDVLMFSSIVMAGDRPGSTVTLVDPRYTHHDAAMALGEFLLSYFRDVIADARQLEPVLSLDEQIAGRNEGVAAQD